MAIKSTLTNNNNTAVIKQLWSNVVSDVLKVRSKPNSYSDFFEFQNRTQSIKALYAKNYCINLRIQPTDIVLVTTTGAANTVSSYDATGRLAIVTVFISYAGHISDCVARGPISAFDDACQPFIEGYLRSVETVLDGITVINPPGEVRPPDNGNPDLNPTNHLPVLLEPILPLDEGGL